MNGAEALLRTVAAAGVEVCFANPGTTELPLVTGLDRVPEIRAVLGLFEGVCTGAADGYARMTGTPALTLLHLGPGLANGLANLHNARRAGSPVVNLVGEHASGHRPHDPALASDIGPLADWASGWVRTSASSAALAVDGAEAIVAAATGRVATLIVPAECPWGPGEPASPVSVPRPAPVSEEEVTAAATALSRGGTASMLLLGGPALSEAGLRAAARIATATGARLMTETFRAAPSGAGACPLRRGCRTSRIRPGRRSTGSRNWSWRVLGPRWRSSAIPASRARQSRRVRPSPSSRAPPRTGCRTWSVRSSDWRAGCEPTTSPSRPCPSPPRRAVRSPPKPSRRPSPPACPTGPWSSTRARPRRWATSRRRQPPRGT